MTLTSRAALIAAGALGLFAAGATQADQRVVHYKKVDLQTQESAATVYWRIRAVAYNLCQQDNLARLRSGRPVHACVDAAVDSAVLAVNSPALTAINEARRARDNPSAGG